MKVNLWPAIKPFNKFTLDVDGYEIYVEECGNPLGSPIIFLHGGPGGGFSEIHRRLFNPKKYRVILFDQRGCGKSTPHACIELNTPQHLVSDVEMIRDYLNIEQLNLFGGSWGTTLALLYALKYPQNVNSMILRGIFLGTKEEIDWIYENIGCANFHPIAYENLIQGLNDKKNIVSQYNEKLKNFDSNYAKKWAIWEGINSGIDVSDASMLSFTEKNLAMSLARISAHFFTNNLFLENDYIIKNISNIQHINTYIVQGGHDLLCPPKAAQKLAKHLNNCKIKIVADAGHSLFEPSLLKEVLELLNSIKV